ncbi:ATP synthase subunit b precursor [Rubripirellula lacrimiformis]|uniref:ATP synthase subunit b n=1 Tax=Rubripirellula lacrimiformis TaxID=1930273 RepID=A0A517N9X6_9BACT|nr:F0F1 ATP synthase subunit B [Rubripirellula lacrimiformis]QDT03808.1 ATP synthase subunit b precursor [Rubripirellula lacrimiformis]
MLSTIGRPLVALSLLLFVTGDTSLVRADEEASGKKADVAEVESGDVTDADHQHDDHPAAEHDGHAEGVGHGESGHGGHGEHAEADGTPPLLTFDMGSAVCNLAIFLGVLAILSKFVWPVILGGLQAREDKIHGELEQAAKANAEAKALLDNYQSKIDEASTKVQTMLAEARKDSEAAGQRIVDEAKAEAERQRQRAVSDIETAKKVAIAELAGQTSDMAINVAKSIVGRELNPGDHAELIRQSLERMPSNN